jgi:hypothetical protein
MKRIKGGSSELRDAINPESDLENVTADGALSVTKGVSRIAGAGALNALTLAAPPAGSKGFKKSIRNTVAFQCTVTVTGMDVAANDAFVLASVAGATTVPASITLEVIDTTPTAATQTLKWSLAGLTGGITVS